jgi:predicted P-loop ATPase
VKNGKRVAGPANIAHITRGIPSFLKVKYDRFEERLMCKLRNESSWREYSDNFRTLVREEIEREYGMTFATTDVASAIHAAGEAHAYDSAQQWLTSQTWDGVPRIKNFASDILKSIGDAYGQALGFYLWVALAARVLAPGVKADMTPVLISPLQGTGKSSLVASLAPFRDWFTDAISLDERDEESSRKLKGKTVVEIPELRGLQSRDAESIKAWMTKQIETWIPKYKETKVDYPRRCIFVGTDNRLRFLSDPSGNRRFLPIRVATQARYIDWPTLKRDVNQYWAEAVSIIRGFNTVDEAVDHYSKVADALAGPSRTAATMLDECHDEIKRLVSIQAEGAPITVRAIRSALNLYATNDRFRIEHTLRLLGYEQIDNTVEWAKKQVSVFL